MTNPAGIKAFIALCITHILEEENMSTLSDIEVIYNHGSDALGLHLSFSDGTTKDCSVCIPGIVTSASTIRFAEHTTAIVEELRQILFEKKFTESLESVLEVENEVIKL